MSKVSSFGRRTSSVAVLAVLASSAVALSAGVANASTSVTLCHRTDSANHPYVEETVSVDGSNGSLGKGQNDHTHHTGPVFNPTLKAQHIKWGDIIPPYSYTGGSFPGMNWSSAGQVILNRGCKYVGPDLAIDKIGTATAHAGDTVSYTVTVTDVPTADATYGSITVRDTLPSGLSNGTLTPAQNPGDWTCSTLSCSTSTIVVQPGSSLVFSVTATVDQGVEVGSTLTNTADVSTTGDTNSSNNEDTADTVVAGENAATPSPLILSASCSPTDTGKVLWTVENPASNDAASGLSVSGATATLSDTSLDPGGKATFTTDPLSPGDTVSVSGTVDEQTVTSNHAGFSDSCAPEVLPEVANPTVAGSHSCKSGISVVLGNMDGTAAARFTVTAPDGSTKVITVRPESMVKKNYKVAEDTTGTVTVESAGLTTKTFTFKKNCTQVLGEKVTKTPTTTPAVLPFTGLPTWGLLGTALALLTSGGGLLALARRRRTARHSLTV